jgi:hypothetical protein
VGVEADWPSKGVRKVETEIEKTIKELNKPIIVRTGWISNGPGSAGLEDISEVFPIEEGEVPSDEVLEFLKRNGWWREESDDEVIQRHYWVRR